MNVGDRAIDCILDGLYVVFAKKGRQETKYRRLITRIYTMGSS